MMNISYHGDMNNESVQNGGIFDDKHIKKSMRKPLPPPRRSKTHSTLENVVDSHNNNDKIDSAVNEKLTTVIQEFNRLTNKSKEENFKSQTSSSNSDKTLFQSKHTILPPSTQLFLPEKESTRHQSFREKMIPFEQPCIDISKSLEGKPSILSKKLDPNKIQIFNKAKYNKSSPPIPPPKPIILSTQAVSETIKSENHLQIDEIGQNIESKESGTIQCIENDDIYDDVLIKDCKLVVPENNMVVENTTTNKQCSVVKNKVRRHSGFCNDSGHNKSLDNRKVSSEQKKSGIFSALVSAVRELGTAGTVRKVRHSSSVFYPESDDESISCQFQRSKSNSLSNNCRLCSTNETERKVNSVFYDVKDISCDNMFVQDSSSVFHQPNNNTDEKENLGNSEHRANIEIRIKSPSCDSDTSSPVIVQSKLKTVDSDIYVMNKTSAIDSYTDLNPKDLHAISDENKELRIIDCNSASNDYSNLKEEEERQRKVFKIAEEMMLSEQVFVDVLKLLNEDFRHEVEKANQEYEQPIIPETTLNQILMYLPQLHEFNEQLLQDLTARISNWDQDPRIADIIMKKGPFLKLYTSYIKEFERMTSSLDDSLKKYRLFAQVVKTFEMSPQCKMLALKHYMLKPIQRIPQYKLLLEDYLKHLPEDALDHKDAVAALKIVSEVANHINDSMKQGEALEKMVSIQNSLQGYEIIKPGRVLLKEGSFLKLSRKGLQPRKFFLFNDCLVYATLSHDNFYKVNHELPLVGMKVNIPASEDFENEFSVLSVKRSITVSVRTSEERDEWFNALTSAIRKVTTRKSTFVKLQSTELEGVPIDYLNMQKLGEHAPVWIPDARVTMCQICLCDFTLTFRRHHCRACGKVICSECSHNRFILQYIKGSSRVCDECHERLESERTENEIYEDIDVNNSPVKKISTSTNPHSRKTKRHVPKILKEVSANEEVAEMSGYLFKRKKGAWKKLWFVLKDKVLYAYKASQDCAALESIPILGYTVKSEVPEGQYNIELNHPGQSPIMFQAENEKIHQRWLKAMKEACVL